MLDTVRDATRIAVLAAAAALPLLGCVYGYEVVVENPLDVPAVVEIAQYDSATLYGTPNKTERVSIEPGKSAVVKFTDAGGGYWLQWRQIEPPPRSSEASTLRLRQDELRIVVAR